MSNSPEEWASWPPERGTLTAPQVVQHRFRLHPVLSALLGLIVLVALWSVVSLRVPSYLLPSPHIVVATILRLAADGSLAADMWVTCFTTLAGLFLGAATAIALALVFTLYRQVEAAVYPTVIALRSIPAVAAAPLLVIWTGTGTSMKVLVSAFVSFFPILVYLLHGLRGPAQEYVDQFSVWAASRVQVLVHLRLPWAVPSFFASLRVAVSYALVGSFVAEMMGSERGLGRMVVTAYYHFDTAVVVAGIVLFAAIGMTLFGAAVWLEGVVLRRIPVSS